jgi:hypothetical protein
MDEPNTLTIALRILLFFVCAFCLPQLAGFVALRSAWRVKKKYLIMPAIVIAPTMFFIMAYVYWEMQANAIRAEGHYVCGLFGAAAFLTTVWGTVIHLCLSAAILFIMWFVTKRRNRLLREVSPA